MAEGKKSKKAGRDTEKAKKYTAAHTREKHKVLRILQSEGPEAAVRFATDAGIFGWLTSTPAYKRKAAAKLAVQ